MPGWSKIVGPWAARSRLTVRMPIVYTSAMSESTITPAAAVEIMTALLPAPMVPYSGTALLARSIRGTAPPAILTQGPGTPPAGRYMYDPAVVRSWCMECLPRGVRDALEALDEIRSMLGRSRVRVHLTAEQLCQLLDDIEAVVGGGP